MCDSVECINMGLCGVCGAMWCVKMCCMGLCEKLLCGAVCEAMWWLYIPAVQMVKTTWTESKKKNMTSRETEAPMGRKRACVESMV